MLIQHARHTGAVEDRRTADAALGKLRQQVFEIFNLIEHNDNKLQNKPSFG